MVSKAIPFTFAVVACCAMLLCVQSQIFDANEDEKQVCTDNANGRELVNAKKYRPLSCEIYCKYDDGNTEIYDSPDGQLCCMVGVLPTGCCMQGMCPPAISIPNCKLPKGFTG